MDMIHKGHDDITVQTLYMLWLHEQAGNSHSPGGPHSVASGPAHLPLWALLGVACIMKGHHKHTGERKRNE